MVKISAELVKYGQNIRYNILSAIMAYFSTVGGIEDIREICS